MMLQIMEEKKVQISVRKLKGYLDEAGIRVSKLAEMSDIGYDHLYMSLCGTVDQRNGDVRTLGRDNLRKLEFGVEQLAYGIGNTFISYDPDLEICKRNGRRYCPACVAQIKEKLRPYMGVLPFMQYALGWPYYKVRNVMDITTSPAYGNISRDDCDAINICLAEVSARLKLFTFS